MSAKKQRLLFPKLEKASLTVWWLTYSEKNSVTKNKLLSISKRTRSLFLETDIYLHVSKTAMDLRNFKFLPCTFCFKNENELRGRNLIQSAYFCDTLSL